jgi:predicted xylose isomerase-like sugar epimerase
MKQEQEIFEKAISPSPREAREDYLLRACRTIGLSLADLKNSMSAQQIADGEKRAKELRAQIEAKLKQGDK